MLLGSLTKDEVDELNTIDVAPRARRSQMVTSDQFGDIADSPQPQRKLPKPKKGPETPAPPMEIVQADSEMGSTVPTDEEFRAMLGLLQAGLAECVMEAEVSAIEAAYVPRCAGSDGEMIEHRLNKVISLCDERREGIA